MIDNVLHGLLLATITGRWLGETPFVQVSTTWALTCPETVHQRPCMTREIETWLSDSRVGNSSVVDHRSRLPTHSLTLLHYSEMLPPHAIPCRTWSWTCSWLVSADRCCESSTRQRSPSHQFLGKPKTRHANYVSRKKPLRSQRQILQPSNNRWANRTTWSRCSLPQRLIWQ